MRLRRAARDRTMRASAAAFGEMAHTRLQRHVEPGRRGHSPRPIVPRLAARWGFAARLGLARLQSEADKNFPRVGKETQFAFDYAKEEADNSGKGCSNGAAN